MLESVDVGRQSIEDYEATTGREAGELLRVLAEPLAGARVLHLNPAPYRGEVATRPRSGTVGPAMRLVAFDHGSSLKYRLPEMLAGSSGPGKRLAQGAVGGEGTHQSRGHGPVLDRQEA